MGRGSAPEGSAVCRSVVGQPWLREPGSQENSHECVVTGLIRCWGSDDVVM